MSKFSLLPESLAGHLSILPSEQTPELISDLTRALVAVPISVMTRLGRRVAF